MARTYYTLCTRDNGVWSPQFGDYDRDTVTDEADDLYYGREYKRRDLKVIATKPDQASINAAVAKLNR